MGKSKKSDNNVAEARPIGEGKDPLAEGNTLINPTNSEAETHYEVKERSEDVQASEIAGQNANERAEEHNAQAAAAQTSDVPNSDEAEQDEVAAGRTEDGEEPTAPEVPDSADVDDTPEEVEVPDVSEEDQVAADAERQDAVETALETTDKPA